MQFRSVLHASLMLCVALIAPLSGVWAQGNWPTVETFHREGLSLPQDELERLLAENASVIGFELGAGSFGSIFRCNGSFATIIQYDSPFSSIKSGECRLEDSTVCIRSSGAANEECFLMGRIPGFDLLFADFAPTDVTTTSEEHIAERRDHAAVAVGLVALDVYDLAAAAGAIDVGAVSISIPPRYQFTLSNASGFPLTFSFEGRTEFAGVALTLEQIGWPDSYSLPSPNRATLPEAMSQASDHLVRWEERFKSRDLGGGGTGARYERAAYRSMFTEQENGPCVRIHEIISIAEMPEGIRVSPARSIYSRQLCISISDGAMVMVNLAFHDPLEDLSAEDAEAEARAILDTLQLGALSGEGRSEKQDRITTELDGVWKGTYTSTTDVGTSGSECTDGSAEFLIEDGAVGGSGSNPYGSSYDVVGLAIEENRVEGFFEFRDVIVGRFKGLLQDGKLIGTFVGPGICEGLWALTRT